MRGALAEIVVVDFSTLLPGPLATLILASVGATVVKVERPGGGDGMRDYEPRVGTTSANFALLNRGKDSRTIDLKSDRGIREARDLIERADVLVEQFRPGVMERLGLGFAEVEALNPRLVYCSITGYGQHGDRAGRAGHDLNYSAEVGLLSLLDRPALSPALIADIGAGAYPAVINILLALADRQRTGRGRHLDIAMADGLFTWMYWALGNGLGCGHWPKPGGELVTGGSARYQVYKTADGRYLAAAPLEDRFWDAFCDAIELPDSLRDDKRDPNATTQAVAERIASRPAAEWERRFADVDACCSLVRDLREAVSDPSFIARGIFGGRTGDGKGATLPALPLPVDPGLRADRDDVSAPPLGVDHESAGSIGGNS